MNKLLAVVLLAALGILGCDASSAGDAVPFSKVEEAERLTVRISGTTVLRTADEWAEFWKRHETTIPARSAPAVDFERQTVIGVFYGGSLYSGCHSQVEVIQEVEQVGRWLEVSVSALPDLGVCRAIVHPLDIVVVDIPPAQALDVRFKGQVP